MFSSTVQGAFEAPHSVPNPYQFGFTSGSEIVENTKIKKNSSILDVLF